MKKQRTPSSSPASKSGSSPTLSFTVFTPTYNRAHTLEKVYNSLKAQTYQNFEWVIIDDGSTDGTASQVQKWIQEAPFPLRYEYQVNQGKHIAFNKGLSLAQGFLFVPLDSDDSCRPEALERLWALWESIPQGHREVYSGICVLCTNERGETVGDSFPGPVMDSTPSEITYKYKVQGEKWGCHRTEVLRSYPFPELEGAKYIPEALLWNQVGQSYKMRCVNEALRIYDQSPAADRLTFLAIADASLLGRVYFYLWSFNHNSSWVWTSPWQFFKDAVQYGRFSWRLGRSWMDQSSRLTSWEGKILHLVATPFSYFLSWWDQRHLPSLGETPSAPETPSSEDSPS